MQDCIVVGAGISGLVAARKLQQDVEGAGEKNERRFYHWLHLGKKTASDLLTDAGHKVLVLEGRDRVGGRTFSTQIGNGVFDLGGAWINKTTQKEIAALVDELGIETYPQYITGKKVVLQGQDRFVYSGTIPKMAPHLILDTQAWLTRVDSAASQIDLANPTRSPRAFELDSITVEGWTKAQAWTRASFTTADVVCRSVLGVEPREISALWFFTNVKSGFGLDPSIIENNERGAQYLRVKNGAQSISIELAKRLQPNTLLLDHQVIRMEQGDTVKVTTAKGETFQCKKLIMAVPPTMVNRIDFSPHLPSSKSHLLQRWGLGYYTKVVCVYKRAFWRLDGYSGDTLADGGVVTMTSDAVTQSKDNEEVAALLCFVLGDPGRKWAGLPAERRRQTIVNELRTLFDNDEALEPIAYREQDWAQEKFSGGCPNCVLPAGCLTSFAEDLKSNVKNVYFAGTEHSLIWNGYMDGAVSSGKEVAGIITKLLESNQPRTTEVTNPTIVVATRHYKPARLGIVWYCLLAALIAVIFQLCT